MRTMHHRKRAGWVVALTVSVTLLLSSPFVRSDAAASPEQAAKTALPRMIDLGRNQCIPCKLMAPVLKELKEKYAGIIDIEYINIPDNPDIMKKLGLPVRAVPFQIFYDASGKDVKRHYGYMSRDEMLQAFRDLGFDRTKAGSKQ